MCCPQPSRASSTDCPDFTDTRLPAGSIFSSAAPAVALRSAAPPTAEALMRSRYTAYVLEEIEYILKTHDPATVAEVDRDGARAWSREAEWRGLEVHHAEGGENDEQGLVEFTAHYEIEGRLVHHRERA